MLKFLEMNRYVVVVIVAFVSLPRTAAYIIVLNISFLLYILVYVAKQKINKQNENVMNVT